MFRHLEVLSVKAAEAEIMLSSTGIIIGLLIGFFAGIIGLKIEKVIGFWRAVGVTLAIISATWGVIYWIHLTQR